MRDSSPVTVAGAAPALHRLPVHCSGAGWERTVVAFAVYPERSEGSTVIPAAADPTRGEGSLAPYGSAQSRWNKRSLANARDKLLWIYGYPGSGRSDGVRTLARTLSGSRSAVE